MPLALLGFLNFTLTDILDILMVAVIIFLLFRWFRGSSAMSIFIAVILLYLVKVVASALNMTLMSGIMSTVLDVGVIALIVIFQPEIRYFLIKLGSRYGVGGSGWKLFDRLFGRKGSKLGSDSTEALVDAVRAMNGGVGGENAVFDRFQPIHVHGRASVFNCAPLTKGCYGPVLVFIGHVHKRIQPVAVCKPQVHLSGLVRFHGHDRRVVAILARRVRLIDVRRSVLATMMVRVVRIVRVA